MNIWSPKILQLTVDNNLGMETKMLLVERFKIRFFQQWLYKWLYKDTDYSISVPHQWHHSEALFRISYSAFHRSQTHTQTHTLPHDTCGLTLF